jgi:predicted GTPase
MKNYSVNKIRQVLSERGLLYPLDVALVGATGVGKSSTLNAIFGEDVAKVGTGVDPETQNVQGYLINDVFRVHDSAGLGDGLSADQRHKKFDRFIAKNYYNQ